MLHETPRNLGNIALLIDADNSQCTIIDRVIEILSQYGEITHRYAYGNWEKLENWQAVMKKNSITPKLRWDYAKGKDATDMELVIDAMDMLHEKSVNAFCIVSSDSDFTSICKRIREEKLMVFGIGKKQTPDAFVNSCYQFFYIEDIEQGVYHPPQPIPTPPSPKPSTKNPNDAIPLIQQALAKLQNPTEWVHLGGLGNALKNSNFQSGNYGHTKLLTLIESLPHHFVIKKQGTIVYVSLKKDAQ